jgi:hypothetical protein
MSSRKINKTEKSLIGGMSREKSVSFLEVKSTNKSLIQEEVEHVSKVKSDISIEQVDNIISKKSEQVDIKSEIKSKLSSKIRSLISSKKS